MTTERRLPKWTQTFIPDKEVAVTPILISVNVIIWLIMIATGVSPYMPTTDQMLHWGATSTDAVTGGDYWRLLTSNYLHYGFLHLGVNMLSLNNVGRLLERFIGKWRFALLYTFTGICASAVSIWWNPHAVGVGASGAILGIVGVLTALLTTNLIDKAVRFKMLRSIGFSIGLMVVLGFSVSGLDNAAHFGGLISGAIGGYFIYPELRAHYYRHKTQYWGLLAALLLIAGIAGWFVIQCVPAKTPTALMNEAKDLQVKADSFYAANTGAGTTLIEKKILDPYETAFRKMDSIPFYDLSPESQELVTRYRAFLMSRVKFYSFLLLRSKTPDNESLDTRYLDSMQRWDSISKKIEPIIINTGQ